eukprot:m.48061 g.48061  ORF g.48061 m.48061 type:complete len:345 (-) comp6014_c0_seq2:205-1239(-)
MATRHVKTALLAMDVLRSPPAKAAGDCASSISAASSSSSCECAGRLRPSRSRLLLDSSQYAMDASASRTKTPRSSASRAARQRSISASIEPSAIVSSSRVASASACERWRSVSSRWSLSSGTALPRAVCTAASRDALVAFADADAACSSSRRFSTACTTPHWAACSRSWAAASGSAACASAGMWSAMAATVSCMSAKSCLQGGSTSASLPSASAIVRRPMPISRRAAPIASKQLARSFSSPALIDADSSMEANLEPCAPAVMRSVKSAKDSKRRELPPLCSFISLARSASGSSRKLRTSGKKLSTGCAAMRLMNRLSALRRASVNCCENLSEVITCLPGIAGIK